MIDNFQILSYPFMQRAIIGGLIVAISTSSIGIFAVLRRASFFGDTIAHAALTGVAIGLLVHVNPYISALCFSLLLSILLPRLERSSTLNIDALLGFMLPVSMALGIILISFIPGYQPDLLNILFGNILSVTTPNLVFTSIIGLTVVMLAYLYRGKLTTVAFDPVYAKITGINVGLYLILHNMLMSAAIVSGINIVGIVLVTALLTIPASSAKIIAHSLTHMVILTPIIAIIGTLSGLLVSISINIPSGPSIVLSLGLIFVIINLVKSKSKIS